MININSYLQKLRLLGVKINTVVQEDRSIYYTAGTTIGTEDTVLILIPDNVTTISPINEQLQMRKSIKVVGGSGLRSTKFMFQEVMHYDLKRIDLNDFDTSNVENMGSMFLSCTAEKIDLLNLNTSKVINMDNMFRYSRAKELDLRNFNTSKVISMDNMFDACRAEYLDLRSFDTRNTRSMRHMFSKCSAKEINLSSFNTSNVEDMTGMFRGCVTKNLDLTSFDMHKVKHMSFMFYACASKVKSEDKVIIDEAKNNGVTQ